jgi:hypothetical protein
MADEIDWSVTTWDGNRRLQHEEFRRLSFREKVAVLEQLGEIAEAFAAMRRQRLEMQRTTDIPGGEGTKHTS